MRCSPVRPSVSAVLFALTICVLPLSRATAQTKNQTSSFVSAADHELSVKEVAVAPFTDNVSGIYARPLTETLREALANDPRWSLAVYPNHPSHPETFEDAPADVQKILREAKADALITGRVLKGPQGLTLRLVLYVGPSGLPLAIEEANEPQRFETERMKEVVITTSQRLRDRLPYRGVVMSRRGQEVTINLGQKSGLRNGTEVDLIQILKVRRHPKLHIVVGTEREILGKVRIFKADEELSFGNITYEKEPGLIEAGAKVLPEEGISYAAPILGPDGKPLPDLSNRPDKNVAFGEKPIEWLPEPIPQYGRVHVMAGIGQYAQTVGLQTAGSTSGSSSMTPNLEIGGEAWIDREWWVGFDLRQSAFSVDNGLAGSTPGKINMSLGKYDVSGGYNFLLGNDFFGPKIQAGLGLGKFSARADTTTPPLFSNMEFGGPFVALTFSTPLGDDNVWDIGARFKYYINPSVSEGLSSGGRKSVSASDFSFLAGYRVRRNFRYIAEANIEYYNADFDGNGDRPDPVSSIGHRATTILGGLEYSF